MQDWLQSQNFGAHEAIKYALDINFLFLSIYNIVRLASFNQHCLILGCVPVEGIYKQTKTCTTPSCYRLKFVLIKSIEINIARLAHNS